MISKTQLRDYEVSIWTLQDSFITVLKNSNLERRGEIEEPQMTLKDDGENSLSFKIPMYIVNENGEYVENPIWYNTINGTIMASLRKIKVIFNKNTDDEKVFEFIITSVTESHEGYKKYCSISCEGLAFHELGKQGYKIALEGVDEIDIAHNKWIETQEGAEPLPTLNYWANRVFANSNWSYEVRMDWSAYGGNRNDSEKVYEETEDIEKYRLIEAKESNRYNLSQTIAETFQVFCRYEYTYDENYHIVGRKAIYYNNFIKETDGIIDLTYKFNTEQLTRTIDGTDLVTKMFVSPLKYNDSSSDEVNISDTEYNEGLEDYILNFDYLYNIGSISQEQYNAIPSFLSAIKEKNQELIQKSEQKIELENEKNKQEARLKIAQYASAQALENIKQYSAIKDSITGGDGSVELNDATSRLLTLIKDGNSYYANLHEKGIDKSSIKIYKTKNNDTLENQINQFVVENDEYGNPCRVKNIPASVVPEEDEPGKYSAYIIYNYNPKIGYENVIHEYEKVKAKKDEIVNDAQNKLGDSITSGIYKDIADIEKMEQTLIQKKQELINEFEHLMGPALREGTWKPEDEYAGYGDNYINSFNSIGTSFDNNIVSLAWDEELFDDEQDIYYYYGPSLEKRYYPIIQISDNLVGDFSTWLDEKLAFIYKLSNKENENMSNKGYMALGSKMIFRYVKDDNNSIFPALILLDAEKASSSELNDMLSNGYIATISIDNNGKHNETERINNLNLIWIIKPGALNSNAKVVYPRFKFNSNKLKSPNTAIIIKNNANILENYEDYYVLNRDGFWYATLKPEVIAQYGENYNVSYTLSTAAKAIYFDAVQILKENSCPKVSYEIELMSLNKEFTHTAYDKLGQIAHINDFELKFENTMGYISEVNLDLDQPWQDKVVIKNYKTKFEDLFSTIVAQTEQMKKNSYIFGVVSDAFNNGKLSDELIDDIYNRLPTQLEHIISPAEIYAQYEPIIRQQLKTSWEEAGKILAAAVSSVNDVNDVILESGNILAGFKEDIAAKLTPSSFIDNNSKERTSTKAGISARDFKVGDVWVHNNSTYIATENSKQLYPNSYPSDILTSLKGWSLVKDGSLAQIKGASFNLDSEHGIIEFEAETSISAKSGGNIALQANNDILIQANNIVNINGAQINLNSLSSTNPSRGILIQAVNNYNDKTASSKIDIKSSGIEMMTAGGISMAGAGGINIYTSNNNFSGTSAISISKDKGIYIGSGKSIILYSGEVPADITSSNYASKGASVLINKDRILFGVSDTTITGTAIDLTKNRIVIGAGADINGNNIENIGSSATGIKITKEAIDFSAGDNNIRSYLHLAKDQILISNTSSSSTGAQVSISQSGIIIGTLSKATNSNKTGFIDKIQSGVLATDPNTATFQVYAPNFVVDKNGHLYANEAYISGTVYANDGSFTGAVIAKSLKVGDKEADTWANDLIAKNSNVTGKARVFTNQPTIPYTKGDIWVQGPTGDIKYCTTSRSSGPYNESEWALAGKYTDDATAQTARTIANNKSTVYTGTTPPANTTFKIGDLFVSTGSTNYPGEGRIYKYTGSDWIATTAGIIKGTKLEADPDNGTVMISAPNTITVSSGNNISITGNGKLILAGGAGIEIGSQGKLSVDTSNVFINTSQTNGMVFRIGSSNDPLISYNTNGELTIKGSIAATSGTIGNATNKINIGSDITNNISRIYSSTKSTLGSDTIDGFYLGTDGLALGKGLFRVTNSGSLTAKNGTVGGWSIDADSIFSGTKTANTSIRLSTENFSRTIADASRANLRLAIGSKFGVAYDGIIYATDADIKGKIVATSFTSETDDFISKVRDGFEIISKTSTSTGYSVRSIVNGEPYSSVLFHDGLIFYSNNDYSGTKFEIYPNIDCLKFGCAIDIGTASIRAGTSGVATIVDCYREGEAYNFCFGAPNGYEDETPLTILRGQAVRIYSHSGGAVYLGSSGATAVTSDETLKNIFKLDNRYYDFFNNIEPIAYQYKIGHRIHLGFGAQSVEQALIKSGLTTEDFAGLLIDKNITIGKDENLLNNGQTFFKELYSLRYEEFIALNTFMIKKLINEINQLKLEINKKNPSI